MNILTTPIDAVAAAINYLGSFSFSQSAKVGQTVHKEVIEVVREFSMSSTSRAFVRIAGLSGAAAVIIGAYGAHVLRENSDISPERKRVFDVGSKYHITHTIALMCTPLCRKPLIAGSLLTAGMLLFSGSCYTVALTGDKRYGKVTPFGGVMLILGWLAIAL